MWRIKIPLSMVNMPVNISDIAVKEHTLFDPFNGNVDSTGCEGPVRKGWGLTGREDVYATY
jgi:hypothetical protein